MYYKHFGLGQPPFRITPDTDFFFEGGNRGAILEALIYAVTQGEGIVKVVGEVGSGKTMLCRVLQSRLPDTIETVYLANPSVSPEEILHAIAFELQLPLPREAGRLEVMHALNEYLLARHEAGRQVVVFVEESQSMPIATLEEIRLLSNLETRRHKLLQIILFGQPELDENLRRPEIRQLRERITHSFNLTPLSESEVSAYLGFRLRAAGYRGPDLFSPRVIRYLWRATGGLTRRVNIVADKALLAAYAGNTHNVGLKHVKVAVADSEFGPPPKAHGTRAWAVWTAAGIGGTVLVVAAFAGAHYYFSSSAGGPSHGAAVAPQPARDPPPPAVAVAASPALADAPPAAPAPAPAASPLAPAPTADPVPPAPVAGPVAPGPAVGPLTPPEATPAAAMPTASTPLAVTSVTEADLDLLEQRLLATERWLAEERGSVFSIQLLGSNDPLLLKRYLETLSGYIEKEKIFVYRTVANQEPSMTVLYGAFPERREAMKSLAALPAQIKANRPYIRTVQGVRAELASNRSL
jgi:type II secretory pathway predicted ATPase ExeA/septal ring-binding cell division protein DamX